MFAHYDTERRHTVSARGAGVLADGDLRLTVTANSLGYEPFDRTIHYNDPAVEALGPDERAMALDQRALLR